MIWSFNGIPSNLWSSTIRSNFPNWRWWAIRQLIVPRSTLQGTLPAWKSCLSSRGDWDTTCSTPMSPPAWLSSCRWVAQSLFPISSWFLTSPLRLPVGLFLDQTWSSPSPCNPWRDISANPLYTTRQIASLPTTCFLSKGSRCLYVCLHDVS